MEAAKLANCRSLRGDKCKYGISGNLGSAAAGHHVAEHSVDYSCGGSSFIGTLQCLQSSSGEWTLKKSENFDLQSEAMASSQTSLRATCQGCNSQGLGMSRAAVGKSKQGRLSL